MFRYYTSKGLLMVYGVITIHRTIILVRRQVLLWVTRLRIWAASLSVYIVFVQTIQERLIRLDDVQELLDEFRFGEHTGCLDSVQCMHAS